MVNQFLGKEARASAIGFVAASMLVAACGSLAACRPNPSDPTQPLSEPGVSEDQNDADVGEGENSLADADGLADPRRLFDDARAQHYTWRHADLGGSWEEMGDAFYAFRDGIGSLQDAYQPVAVHVDREFAACALYLQGRVYADAAGTLYAQKSTDLFQTMLMFSPDHGDTVDNSIARWLDAAILHWDYAEPAVRASAPDSDCARRLVEEATCARANASGTQAERVACTADDDPYLDGPE